MPIRHAFVSPITDDLVTDEIGPDDWNDDHVMSVPDLLNSPPPGATPDAEFDGTISPFTAVDGTSGTATLLAGSGGTYDLSTRPGWILLTLGTASGDSVELKQDYTLPDGKCLVGAFFCGWDKAASVSNNEIHLGIGVNQNDAGPYSGTAGLTASIIVDTESGASSNARVIGWDGTSEIGSAPGGGHIPGGPFFFRIDRSTLTYNLFFSLDGFSWTYLGAKTMASQADNIWLIARCAATMVNRITVACPWIREGTALAIDPFPLT